MFSYWIGNGDMHLKNIALLEDEAGQLHLSPAYDLLSTRLYGDTTMCLPLNKRQEDFTRGDWLTYAARDCGIPRNEAKGILAQMVARLDDALALVDRSPLPDPEVKEKYRTLLRLRGELLVRASSPPPGAA